MLNYIPPLGEDFRIAVVNRDTALRAYLKALKAGRRYEAEGMSLQRYAIDELRTEYIFWRDQVNNILRHGDTSTMVYKRLIPVDR